MKLYEKHILYVYFISFVKTLLFISSIIIAIKTLDIAQSLTEDSSISLSDISLISLHISPYILYTITPFALTITSFSVFYKLLTHSEIITLQNAGLTNIQIIRPHMFVSCVCTVLMLYSSAIVIPKTVQIRKNLQEAIIKRKIENFLTPNIIKEIKDITILTSQLDKSKKIALTVIHKPTKSGETVLIGNIRQSWEKNGMIGLITDNATVLSINGNTQKVLQFHTLETQINPFSEYKETADLRHLTTPEIIKMHLQSPQNEYIATINSRIMPSLAATLLPFGMAVLIIKFYQNRSRYQVLHIVTIALTLLYILFSCYNLSYTFTSKNNFYLLYINIILTFIAIYLLTRSSKKLY
jgi:lipopolysaccharide export LptBFGC system permease protein LptF